MNTLRNKKSIGIFSMIMLLVVVALVLTISTSYFNTKELNNIATQCYENNGVAKLEIHNNLTNRYSFECGKQ